MAIGGARVGKTAENFGCWVALLATRVVNGDRIFIVADADVAASVTTVWAFIGDALSVVHVPVLSGASGRFGVLGIGEINVLQTASAARVARLSSNSDCVLVVPIDNYIVCAADRDGVREETDQVSQGVKGGWATWVKV